MKRSDLLANSIILALLIHHCAGSLSAHPAENLTTGPPKGHPVFAGGGLRNTTAFNLFIRLAGGPEAPVVIIATAADVEFFASSNSVGMYILILSWPTKAWDFRTLPSCIPWLLKKQTEMHLLSQTGT